jgi:hypothetical protein
MHDSALPLIACEHSLTLPAGAVIAIARANVHAESYHRMALALDFPVNDIGMVLRRPRRQGSGGRSARGPF